MAAAPSDDDATSCPLCHTTLGSEGELQLHYLQSCPGYDNEVAGDAMKLSSYRPPATQQNYSGSYDRSSDRLAPSSNDTTVDRSRTAVSGGDGNHSGLSQHLVKFVWYPNDPFKVHESKATLLSSFTAGGGSVELFKDKNEDIGSYSSSTVAVRIGKFDDGQIVVGDEILEVEPYEVSNDSEEIYLITKDKDSPGPPPVNPKVTSGVPPTHTNDSYYGTSQATVPTVPPSYGDRSAVLGADMMGRDFTRHSGGGRSAPGYSEDTGAAMQQYTNQNHGQQFTRMPADGQLYGQHSSPPYSQTNQYSLSPGVMQQRVASSESFPSTNDIEAIKRSSGMTSTGRMADEFVVRTALPQEQFVPTISDSPKQTVFPTASPNYKSTSPLSSSDLSAHLGQRPIQQPSDATMYGDAARFVGAKPNQDFSSGGISSSNVMVGRENDLAPQKPGIDLQKLGGIEDTTAQERIRALEEKLLKTEQEKEETKRNMERSNTVLNSRIRRLEDQLTKITGSSNENDMADVIMKLNMRISELESTEHMMKESSSNQSEIERQYHQQLQELEKKCAEQKEHIVNLEAICAMEQGESFKEAKKELDQNKAVIARLQAQSATLQSQLQACDAQYKQVASSLEDAHQKQTDLLEESRGAMTKTMQLTEENAKLHEQNFNLMEDVKSLKAKLQEGGGAGAGLANDEELNTLRKENVRLQRDLKVQAENSEREQQMLEQKNSTVAAELQRLRDLQGAGSGEGSPEVQGLKEEIATLQTSYQSTHQQMEQEIAALEQQTSSFQEQVAMLQSSKDELLQRITTVEQEKATLTEHLKRLQRSSGTGSSDSEVSTLRDQLNQITVDRDNIKRQLASTEHFKTLLEGENAAQNATITTLRSQISAEKESSDSNGEMVQAKLASAEEAVKRATEESAAKDTTINDLHTRMLELQQTRGQLEKEVAEMRDQKEKMLMENAQLREVATQPTKYQHAVEENKQLKRDNQELGNALERAQAELQVFKENSMALKEQLDKATDQATLDVITDKMSKYKNERDDARAQVQALQEQLHSQGSSGGGASADIVIKMSRYRDERNEALVQVQAQQAEIAKLSNIIAQMASSQAAAQPSATIFNRQTSEEQPSSLPSSHGRDAFTPESERHVSASDIPPAQSPLHSSGKYSDKHLSMQTSLPKIPNKSPQGTKKVSSALRQPNKRTAKSVIKEVDIANGKQEALCEPVSSTLEVKKGQRVVVCRAAGNGYGTVRAVNVSIDGKKNFTGVEMDLPSGTTDGEVKGVRHFKCKPKHAVFVPVKTIFKLIE